MVYIPKDIPRFENCKEKCAHKDCDNEIYKSSHWCIECKDKPKRLPKCACGRDSETFKMNEDTQKVDIPCCVPCLEACFPGLFGKKANTLKCFSCDNDFFYFAPSIEELKEELEWHDKELLNEEFNETRNDANIQAYLIDENWEDMEKCQKRDRRKVLGAIVELSEYVFIIHGDDIREEMFE